MIVDANVVLRAFFPDEAQASAQALVRDHVMRRRARKAPELLPDELANAVWQAQRRGRISDTQAEAIVQAMQGLRIEILPLEWGEMLPLARRFDRSAYDAAYLVMAQKLGEPLITGDERLYRAVHPRLEWVLWVEDYGK